MRRHFTRIVPGFIMFLMVLALPAGALAQNAPEEATSPDIPTAFALQNVRYEPQGWNNCGPATLTNALSFFGYTDNQQRAARWLKPNGEDKNVSPWQMVEFVNTQVPELPVSALERVNGTLDLLKVLIANEFPVIIEKGYDPEPDRLGWMGHYLLMIGYDDAASEFTTHDSYIGANVTYSYDYIEEFWQHFNYTYIVLYRNDRETELLTLLGLDADERRNHIRAFERAQQQAVLDQNDAFAWFNMGSSLVALEYYEEAARAYDVARNIGLPWRMMWYQFGPFEAYYNVERYDDMIALARSNLNDGGGQYVEETFYYGGLARMGMGEYDRAMSNFQAAIQFNPNFTPAIEAQTQLQAQLSR